MNCPDAALVLSPKISWDRLGSYCFLSENVWQFDKTVNKIYTQLHKDFAVMMIK